MSVEDEGLGLPDQEILLQQLKPGNGIVSSPAGVEFTLAHNDYNGRGEIIGNSSRNFSDVNELARYLGMDAKLIHDGLVVRLPENITKKAA